jgi:hypothetical protein
MAWNGPVGITCSIPGQERLSSVPRSAGRITPYRFPSIVPNTPFDHRTSEIFPDMLEMCQTAYDTCRTQRLA